MNKKKSSSASYCCLVLTKNEEKTIASVLEGLRARLSALGVSDCQFVVSDDSHDRTAEIAASLGASVVSGGNQGLGSAYQAGLRECVKFSPARIFVVDGDGQADLAEMGEFIATMDRTEADLITGSRFLAPRSVEYPYPLINRTGVRLLALYLSAVTGQKFTDSHGGLRLMSGRLAAVQRIHGKHTYVQESIVDAIGNGFEVREIPSRWKRRDHGESRVVRSVFRYARRTLPLLIYRAAWIMGRRAGFARNG